MTWGEFGTWIACAVCMSINNKQKYPLRRPVPSTFFTLPFNSFLVDLIRGLASLSFLCSPFRDLSDNALEAIHEDSFRNLTTLMKLWVKLVLITSRSSVVQIRYTLLSVNYFIINNTNYQDSRNICCKVTIKFSSCLAMFLPSIKVSHELRALCRYLVLKPRSQFYSFYF